MSEQMTLLDTEEFKELKVKPSTIDIINSIEIIEKQGGDDAYILIADSEENRKKLRTAGLNDHQIEECACNGTIDLLWIVAVHAIADDYKDGKFIAWEPLSKEERERVHEGNGDGIDAIRLLRELEEAEEKLKGAGA